MKIKKMKMKNLNNVTSTGHRRRQRHRPGRPRCCARAAVRAWPSAI